ncbi:MAG TPA: hypothetical protein VFH63_05775 [candidate division Zixibacteria bacterium]|nr:hypothetical protein [candidate division Zixibacteria bacterium]
MPHRANPYRAVAIAVMFLVAMPRATLAVPNAAAPSTPVHGADVPEPELERFIEPDEIGLEQPVGIAWNARAGQLIVLDGSTPGRGQAMSLAARLAGPVAVGGAIPGAIVTYDAGSDQLVAVDPIGSRATVTGRGAAISRALALAEPKPKAITGGAVVDGALWLLDGAARAMIRVPAAAGKFDGSAAVRIALPSGTGNLVGLAHDAASGNFFTYETATSTLLEVDASGEAIASRSLAGMGLDNVQGLAVAPSADTTDDPDETAVYLADAGFREGAAVTGAGVYEVSLTTTAVLAATASVSLVNTINTGSGSTGWEPDSPDPSGLAYIPGADRLVLADGEVDEGTGAGFHDVNVWWATRAGVTTGPTMNSVEASDPTNKEPVGVAYDPVADELYLCRDGGESRVWVFDATTLAQKRSFRVDVAPYTDADAEGLAFGGGFLYMVDAVDNDLVKVGPGDDQVVGTPDDSVTNFDLEQYGQKEPEGLDVHPETGNIWVVSNRVRSSGPDPMLEITPNGELVSSVSIEAANPNSAGGLAVAPASDGSGAINVYVADRGVDNADDPSENDGKIYEFSLADGGAEPPPPPPPPGENLLFNPGFELDDDANGPDGWTTHASFTRSSAITPHEGNFVGSHSSTAGVGYTVYQVVEVTAGTIYAFSGWINIPDTTDRFTFKLKVQWRNPQKISVTTFETIKVDTDGTWVQLSENLVAPAGATSVRLMMTVNNLNTSIYVDEFSFAAQ